MLTVYLKAVINRHFSESLKIETYEIIDYQLFVNDFDHGENQSFDNINEDVLCEYNPVLESALSLQHGFYEIIVHLNLDYYITHDYYSGADEGNLDIEETNFFYQELAEEYVDAMLNEKKQKMIDLI